MQYRADKTTDVIEEPIEKVETQELEEYIVKDGDTLVGICKIRYGTTSKMKEICEINKIDDDILREVSINKLSKETEIDIDILKSKLIKKEPVKIERVERIQKVEKVTVSEKQEETPVIMCDECAKKYIIKSKHRNYCFL